MKTIIGIGNPGKKYEYTRHNAGVLLANYLNKNNNNLKLLISDKFMNSSGEFVVKHLKYSNIDLEDLYIAHDDLDIPLGEYKITKKSPKVHNGITSINEKLDTEDYWKIRIGIDNRPARHTSAGVAGGDPRISGKDYVLENFSSQELEKLKDVFANIKNDL